MWAERPELMHNYAVFDTICNVYIPHSGKPFHDRQAFFQSLGKTVSKISHHGPLVVIGDFSARLHRHFDSDPTCIGPHVFGCSAAEENPQSNRSLLLQLCETFDFVVANTMFDHEASKQVTVFFFFSAHLFACRPRSQCTSTTAYGQSQDAGRLFTMLAAAQDMS